jgi:hypothetical protein
MKRLFVVLLLLCPALAQSTPRAFEVLNKFDLLAQKPLWPGFEPQKIAVELYDGTDTYLFHHPKPPEGFTPVAGAPGVFVFHGQHDSVRANTGTELNGVLTATADISKSTATIDEQAALLIHESFHVYEKQAHPKWAANEAELFTYPMDDGLVLAGRRLETLALLRALAAKNGREARCWAETALRWRGQRFGRMPSGAAGYERGIELNEGMAQYVEYKSIGKKAALTQADFPLELIRQRGYATGQAWAVLLDQFGGEEWKASITDTPLDEHLNGYFQVAAWRPSEPCELSKHEETAVRRQAEEEVTALVANRRKRRQDFLAAPGWRLEIVAGAEPLWPQGFDPWNVHNLGSNDILHTRWVKLGNKSGAIEIMNHASLTEGVGPHPLFNGEKRLIVTGLGPVSFTDKDGKVAITSDAAKGTFAGASVTQQGQTVVVNLP